MPQLSLILFSEREEAHGQFAAVLEDTGHARVVDSLSDPSALRGAVYARQPDVIFIELGEKADQILDAVEALREARPGLLVTGPQDASHLILRSMRLGAREYLPCDFDSSDLRSALDQFLLPPVVPRKAAPILAVLGSKGGVGATLVACELANSLQRMGRRTTLVDLNLRSGDAALYLDLEARFSIADLARSDGPLDETYIQTLLQTHACGLRVLCAPEQAEEAELVGPDDVDRVVTLLRPDCDWLVVDLPRSFDEITLRVLDLADQILLVASLDIPSLHHARRTIDLLKRLGHSGSRLRVVTNRHSRGRLVTDRDSAEFLDRTSDARIPNDYAATQESVNFGRPIIEASPHSLLNPAFEELAARVHDWCGIEHSDVKSPGRVIKVRNYLRKKLRGAD